MTTQNAQIQLRRDTAADWTTENPTLAEGELGLETDTYKFKWGDGVTNWVSLAYFSGGGGGSPGGSDTQIQFNDGGSFGGSELLYIGGSSLKLKATDQVVANSDGKIFYIYGSDGKGSGQGGPIFISAGNTEGGEDAAFFALQGGKLSGNADDCVFYGAFSSDGDGGGFVFYGTAGGGLTGNGGNIEFAPGSKTSGGINGVVKFTDPISIISALLDTSLLDTSDKTFAFPNQSGTIALISDIPGVSNPPKTITVADSPYTVLANDGTILCDASGGAITVNLPSATGGGKVYDIKKIDSSANGITIDGSGAETIDGASTLSISLQYASYSIQDCDTGIWYII